MIEFLWALGCILGYLMAGAGTARIYYVRAADAAAARAKERQRDFYVHYEADSPEFESVIVFLFWWLVVPGYLVRRLYCRTILAPTPRQRAEAERKRHELELSELERLNDAVARWQPGGSPAGQKPVDLLASVSRASDQGVFRFMCSRCGTGKKCSHPTQSFLSADEFKAATQAFLDGDELRP